MIELDLSKESAAGLSLDLTKDAPQLKHLKGVLNWDPHPLHAACVNNGYDLDIFVFCVNAQGKITNAGDVVYFKNKVHASGAIAIPVDNQTGDGDDDEYFTMDLDKLPTDRSEFHVYCFIHEAEQRGQNFGMIANTKFDVINDDTGAVEVRYQMTQQYSNETCLHVLTVVRGADGHYSLRPAGVGAVACPNEVLKCYM